MKQTLFVLAILISGIASAQSNWEVSVCDGELVHNYQRYDIIDNLLTTNLQGRLPGNRPTNPGGFFCLEDLITVDSNFNRYFRWYQNATESDPVGHEYTDNRSTVRRYTFPGNISIWVYPSNYADGRNGRLGHIPTHELRAGMFEVQRGIRGTSTILSDDNRFHSSAQSAWNWAQNN